MFFNKWYRKHGFRPANSSHTRISVPLLKQYNNNIKIIKKIKVKDIATQLKTYLTKANNKFRTNLNIGLLIEKNKENLLSQFLKLILKKFDKFCQFFESFYLDLAFDIGIKDFNHETFILIFK